MSVVHQQMVAEGVSLFARKPRERRLLFHRSSQVVAPRVGGIGQQEVVAQAQERHRRDAGGDDAPYINVALVRCEALAPPAPRRAPLLRRVIEHHVSINDTAAGAF